MIPTLKAPKWEKYLITQSIFLANNDEQPVFPGFWVCPHPGRVQSYLLSSPSLSQFSTGEGQVRLESRAPFLGNGCSSGANGADTMDTVGAMEGLDLLL